jgi:hypothetical protein
MNSRKSSTFVHAVELFDSIGKTDTEPPGTATGPTNSWLVTNTTERRSFDHELFRRQQFADYARFEFMRTAPDGNRYDAQLVVSFYDDPRDDVDGHLLKPTVYTRTYHLKSVEERTCEYDHKACDSKWLTTGRQSMAVDELVAAFDAAADHLFEHAEKCGTDRRREIAAAVDAHYNDPPETEETTLGEFA